MSIQHVPFRLPGADRPGNKYFRGHKLCVELYQRTLRELFVRAQPEYYTSKGYDGYHMELPPDRAAHAQQLGVNLFHGLSAARLFMVPSQLYEMFLMGTLRELIPEWKDLRPALDAMAEKQALTVLGGKDYGAFMDRQAKGVELPEKLPFKTMYLSLDVPLQLEREQIAEHGVVLTDVTDAWLYAFLINAGKSGTEVIAFLSAEKPGGEHPYGVLCAPVLRSFVDAVGEWDAPCNMYWATVPLLIEWLKDHQVLVEEKTRSFDYRRAYKKGAKAFELKPLPPPFYVVRIKDQTIYDEAFKVVLPPKVRRKPQHRYDVRGCRNLRVCRGQMPLDPKLEKRLRKDSRRKIYMMQDPPSDVTRELVKRGMGPKRRDEWMAVLSYWRNPHRKGPEDGPYVPAVRVSARGRHEG